MTEPDEQTRVASWRLLLSRPVTVVSAAVLAVIVLVGLFAGWLIPYGINDIDVPNALQHPSGAHWFGTSMSLMP